MLVLSRKVGERIVIGDSITVVVGRISGNRVSIGVEAPEDVKIIRGELRPFVDDFDDAKADMASPSVLAPPACDFVAASTFPPRLAR